MLSRRGKADANSPSRNPRNTSQSPYLANNHEIDKALPHATSHRIPSLDTRSPYLESKQSSPTVPNHVTSSLICDCAFRGVELLDAETDEDLLQENLTCFVDIGVDLCLRQDKSHSCCQGGERQTLTHLLGILVTHLNRRTWQTIMKLTKHYPMPHLIEFLLWILVVLILNRSNRRQQFQIM